MNGVVEELKITMVIVGPSTPGQDCKVLGVITPGWGGLCPYS